jgi:endonuclease YncB( thermonuclease family)
MATKFSRYIRVTDKVINGTVVCIEDGDTICIRRHDDGGLEKIRVYAVDCPEGKQPFGDEAKRFTTQQVLNKEVLVEVKQRGRDPYSRIVGAVGYQESGQTRDLGLELIKEGLAWWWFLTPQTMRETALGDAEADAQRKKKGLWSLEKRTAPWNFRKEQEEAAKKAKEERMGAGTYTLPATPLVQESRPHQSESQTEERKERDRYPTSSGSYYPSSSAGQRHETGTVHVREYQRQDGTVVREHTRSAPHRGHSSGTSSSTSGWEGCCVDKKCTSMRKSDCYKAKGRIVSDCSQCK